MKFSASIIVCLWIFHTKFSSPLYGTWAQRELKCVFLLHRRLFVEFVCWEFKVYFIVYLKIYIERNYRFRELFSRSSNNMAKSENLLGSKFSSQHKLFTLCIFSTSPHAPSTVRGETKNKIINEEKIQFCVLKENIYVFKRVKIPSSFASPFRSSKLIN